MKILLIRAGALGDTLMLMPCIDALKKEHQIAVAGRNPGIAFLAPYTNECFDMERGGWHKLFVSGDDIDLPVTHADHVIAFVNDRDNLFAANLKKVFRHADINIFPPFPEEGSETHVALYMLRKIKSAGINIDCESQFQIACRKPLIQKLQAGGSRIMLHPGSGSEKKNYSADFWFELASAVKDRLPSKSSEILFLLGPAEEQKFGLFKQKAEELDAGIIICPDNRSLLELLKESCLYIGHDSGVTHLAAMMGINTVVLFKNSSPACWHPLGPGVKVIKSGEDIKSIRAEILESAGC